MSELARNLFVALLVELFVVIAAIRLQDDKRKVALVVAIGTLLAGAIGFGPSIYEPTNSSSTNPPSTEKVQAPPDKLEYPSWVKEVSRNQIIPGVGLGGIKVGMAENRVIELLGQPTTPVFPVTNQNGGVLHYALAYKFSGITLNVFIRSDTRTMRGLRLSDGDFNNTGDLPSVTVVSIGSPVGREKGKCPLTPY